MENCKTYGNLGVPPCDYVIANARAMVFVPEFGSSGDKNEFASVAAVTKIAMQAKFDAAKDTDRIYPIHNLKNVEITKDDSIFEEFSDGTKSMVRENPLVLVAHLANPHPYLKKKLDNWKNERFGLYFADAYGSFIYETDAETLLKVRPIMVDGGSMDVVKMPAGDDSVTKYKISITFKSTNDDSLWRRIKREDLDFDPLSTSDFYSLLDVSKRVVFTSANATTAIITLTDDYRDPVEGLTLSEGFSDVNAIYNVTNSTPAVITGVTESPAGTYTIVYNTGVIAAGDTVRCTPTKSRFSFNEGNGFTVTAIA